MQRYRVPPGRGAALLKKHLEFVKSLGTRWGNTSSSKRVPKILTVYYEAGQTRGRVAQ